MNLKIITVLFVCLSLPLWAKDRPKEAGPAEKVSEEVAEEVVEEKPQDLTPFEKVEFYKLTLAIREAEVRSLQAQSASLSNQLRAVMEGQEQGRRTEAYRDFINTRAKETGCTLDADAEWKCPEKPKQEK